MTIKPLSNQSLIQTYNSIDNQQPISPSQKLQYEDKKKAKKNEVKENWLKDLFKKFGYFAYDIFLLVSKSFDGIAHHVEKMKWCTPLFMGIEALCLIVNIKDLLDKAKREGYSKLKTTIEILGESIQGIVLGLLLPDKLIHFIQKLFKTKKTLPKAFAGIFALFVLEALMMVSEKFIKKIADWIDKRFSKKQKII